MKTYFLVGAGSTHLITRGARPAALEELPGRRHAQRGESHQARVVPGGACNRRWILEPGGKPFLTTPEAGLRCAQHDIEPNF